MRLTTWFEVSHLVLAKSVDRNLPSCFPAVLSMVLKTDDKIKKAEFLLYSVQSVLQLEAMFARLTSAISDLGVFSYSQLSIFLPALLLLPSVSFSLPLPCHTFLFTSHHLILSPSLIPTFINNH